jgi:hypothetical protein
MPDDPTEARLAELLILWEERREAGEAPTPESICAGCPELIEELRRRIEVLRSLDPLLGDDARAGPPPGPEA